MIMVIPAVLSGISFPLAFRLITYDTKYTGMYIGKLIAINTAGSIAGSFAIGFIFLPGLRIHKTLLLTTGISIVIGGLVILILEKSLPLYIRYIIILQTVFLWAVIPPVTRTNLPADFLGNKSELLDYREGISSFLSVLKKNRDHILEIDRLWQGQKQKGHQIMAAHIPMLLHREPHDVLVIGIGAGQTAGRFLLYDVKNVDCVDLEGSLSGLIRKYFDPQWLTDPRMYPIVEDGRNYCSYTNKKYDVVSIEAGQTFRPQVASFYTVDFYTQVKNLLNKDGLVCQFVPLGFLSENEFHSVVHSFLTVFPKSTLWNNLFSECILIGSISALPMLSKQRLNLLNADSGIHRDLEFSYGGSSDHFLNQPPMLAASFLMGPLSLEKMSRHAPLYFDDVPVLEYRAAKKTYARPLYLDSIQKYLNPPENIIEGGFDDSIRVKTLLFRRKNF
jgi:spermidine synthase